MSTRSLRPASAGEARSDGAAERPGEARPGEARPGEARPGGEVLSVEAARRRVRDYHARRGDIEEAQLDAALGLPPGQWRLDAAADNAAQRRHPGESIVNVATPYAICRGLIEALSPRAGDTVIDLGCGDGRVVLYGALVSEARFVGIELLAERVACGRRAILWLGLDNAAIEQQNALEFDYDGGDMFYLFRPFSVETEEQVLAQLHRQAARRSIVVAAHRISPSSFDPRVFERVSTGALCVFRS